MAFGPASDEPGTMQFGGRFEPAALARRLPGLTEAQAAQLSLWQANFFF